MSKKTKVHTFKSYEEMFKNDHLFEEMILNDSIIVASLKRLADK